MKGNDHIGDTPMNPTEPRLWEEEFSNGPGFFSQKVCQPNGDFFPGRS